MPVPAESTDRWVVSTRAYGEVLAAEASVSGLQIRLLGLPAGFSPAEVEGWISSLAAAAVEGSAAAIPDDPLPPPVRHALGGLLFSHAELWESSDPAPCSVVFMREHGRIAFGWVGDASVEVYVDGDRIEPEWISVRDHAGGEARAWCGESGRDTRIEIAHACGAGSDVPWCRLEAHWSGNEPRAAIQFPWEQAATVEAPGVEAAIESATEAEPAPMELVSGPETPELLGRVEHEAPPVILNDAWVREEKAEQESESGRPSSGVARWLARHLGWGEQHRGVPEGAKEAEPRATVANAQDTPGEPEPAVVAEAAAAEAGSSIPKAIEPVQALEPEPPRAIEPEPPRAIEPEPPRATAPAGVPPEMPDLVPPTPEPPSLTARAVREDIPVADPREITLSGEAAAEEPASSPRDREPDPWAVTLDSLRGRGPSASSGAPSRREETAGPAAGALWIENSSEAGAQAAAFGAEVSHAEDGSAAEWAAPVGGARAARARRPDWPAAARAERPVSWGRWAAWTAFVLMLFGGGWMMGSFQTSDEADGKSPALIALLRKVGLAGARFEARVRSRPAGARIIVDGSDTGLRTPATLSLPPGPHRLDLALANLGSASFKLEGARGARVPVDAALWGSVRVAASDPSTAVRIAVDGTPRGFVPITIDSLAPGPHELRFTGPGMVSWGSTVEVRVGEAREVLAYPLQSPATGLLQVRASLNEEGDSQPLNGARVWVDGRPRGVTPLILELPRGPHSVRVAREHEEAPIQVIDLPGGNQRFATFEFGLGSEFPRIALRAPPQFPVEEPILISATLTQVPTRDVREMWLHVRTQDGGWRRYSMTLLEAQGGAVGAAPFPAALLGPQGTTQYYVSAATSQGDEVFTEIQTAQAQKRPAARGPAPTPQ